LGGKNLLFVGILKVTEQKSSVQIAIQLYGSADPDPYQNVTGSEHGFI